MFDLTDARKAEWSTLPDHRFPDTRSVWIDDRYALGELPKAGNGLRILCCGCWSHRWIGGQEICRRWPEWLARPGLTWARALRCDGCGAKRFRMMCESDPGAHGFADARTTGPIASARRLGAWLKDGPLTVSDLAPYLVHMPSPEEMAAAGV